MRLRVTSQRWVRSRSARSRRWSFRRAFRSKSSTAFARGQARAARALGCPVVGGNIARGERLGVTTSVLGVARRPLRRDGARSGDEVWLIGAVGLAAAGFALLRGAVARRDVAPERAPFCAWRRPRALIREGLSLAGARERRNRRFGRPRRRRASPRRSERRSHRARRAGARSLAASGARRCRAARSSRGARARARRRRGLRAGRDGTARQAPARSPADRTRHERPGSRSRTSRWDARSSSPAASTTSRVDSL